MLKYFVVLVYDAGLERYKRVKLQCFSRLAAMQLADQIGGEVMYKLMSSGIEFHNSEELSILVSELEQARSLLRKQEEEPGMPHGLKNSIVKRAT